MSFRGEKVNALMNLTVPEILIITISLMLFQVAVVAYILRRKESDTVRKLERQIAILEAKVTLLETAHMDSPMPMWMKDNTFCLRALNRAYEQMFLVPRGYNQHDYLHGFDEDVWPDDIAREYRNNDLYVMNTGRVLDTKEKIVDHQGNTVHIRVIKWPRKVGEVTVGIAGMAIIHDP